MTDLHTRIGEWQLIETAPKDRPILAVETNIHGADVPSVVEWKHGGWQSYDAGPRQWIQATHWMPLPEPPAAEPSQ